eukprot:COSAG01_NODE_18194_length_1094_cov_1.240201_1_plen_69_part_00
MREINALSVELGCQRTSELVNLVNLMMLYSLHGDEELDFDEDPVTCRLLAEAASAMTPSPTSWREVPR